MKNLPRSAQPWSRVACHARRAAVAAAFWPAIVLADQGLAAGSGEWLWPQWQARINVQTAALGPLALAPLGGPTSLPLGGRTLQGAALLGDYVFALPGFGNFRATSGVMLGGPGGAPVLSTSPSSRIGFTVYDNGPAVASGNAEGLSTLPYIGLGYSSPALWRSLSVSADVGLVAGRPAGIAGVGRAVFGSQPLDSAVRDLRLAPVLQLGVRYSF